MFISSILIFAYNGATGTSVSLSAIPAISWWSIAYLVIVGSILTFIAFIYALQNLPAEISTVYSYINPIVAVILGALIFSETLNAAIAIGGGVTLSGLYLVNYSLRKTRK
jgi:drug/metabolite transporter (DMT)-like permease